MFILLQRMALKLNSGRPLLHEEEKGSQPLAPRVTKALSTSLTSQHNNQSHSRREDGGIGDEHQVGT